jgi:hypothetical protein
LATKKPNHLTSAASLLVIFLLFASVITSSLNLFTVIKDVQTLVLTENSSSPYRTDNQLPFEETEKEEEHIQTIRFFIGFFEESVSIVSPKTAVHHCTYAPSASANLSGAHIYLFTKTLLI